MEQKINEENIENNLVFWIDPRKAFTSHQINAKICFFFFFLIRHIRTNYVYFLFRLNFDFGFFTKA